MPKGRMPNNNWDLQIHMRPVFSMSLQLFLLIFHIMFNDPAYKSETFQKMVLKLCFLTQKIVQSMNLPLNHGLKVIISSDWGLFVGGYDSA